MSCTTGSHVWMWFSVGSADTDDPPPSSLRCDCGQYTRRGFDSLSAALQAETARADGLVVQNADLRAAIQLHLDAARGRYGNVDHATADTESGLLDILDRAADGRGAAIMEAAGRLATVLDVEIMPRYREMFEAAGLGDFAQSVAVGVATEALDRWRALVPERAGAQQG